MKSSKHIKGNSQVELVMVMTLLILFGVTVFTLIAAGSNAQAKLIANKNSQTDARVAVSYLNVKIRQNDTGNIVVKPCPVSGESALLIQTRGDDSYDTWVYFFDGMIYEFIGLAGEEPSVDLSVGIIAANDLTFEYDPGTERISAEVFYDYAGTERSVSLTLNLRSGKTVHSPAASEETP